ncbi:MAG: hypothetical protein QNJ33_05075 [Crocosphaera sp.]|nr:hypothetical protein [Crocosphaera sp.]
MDGYKVRLFIFCLIVGLYLSLSHPFYPALALQEGDSLDGSQNGGGFDDGGDGSDTQGNPDFTIETEIGPEFKETDSEEIEACSLNVFANKFPLDFVQAPVIEGTRSCPELTMFGITHQACFIVDVFERIEPGILAAMFILAIISL